MPENPNSSRLGESFVPKLVSALRERYDLERLRADLFAGLSVAIVALPLSMAIAIASGATPERGLYSAIAGGFIVSALGGSRFQIGGPAGAFIVLVAATVERHGLEGLWLAMMLAGAALAIGGLLRLGELIRRMPHAVTVGFTAGIGVIIFASELGDFFGLRLAGKEPGELLPKLAALWSAANTTSPAALLVSLLTIATIEGVRRLRPNWPALLMAVVLASLLAHVFGLQIETIGSRFGELPRTLPWPSLPPISAERVLKVLPDAASFALLGAVESLLSAVVADGMSGRRHRPNIELVAQGLANVVAACFGGVCVTGTIARTATNVRAGAKTPLSGIFHCIFLALAMLLAAPLAGAIPLAALAGLLGTVCWRMIERRAIAGIAHTSPGDFAVLCTTFAVTLLRDLTTGILAGIILHLLIRTAVRLRGRGSGSAG